VPFTLAHPAVVLPLHSKWRTVFLALVVGSIAPYIPYFFPGHTGDRFPNGHTLLGSIVVSIPLGITLLVALISCRVVVVAPMWGRPRVRVREALERLRHSRAAWVQAVPAICIGVWLLLLWDSFTHRDLWFVTHFPSLSADVSPVAGHPIELFRALYYLSSFVGFAATVWWSLRRVHRSAIVEVGDGPGWRLWALVGAIAVSCVWALAVARAAGPRYSSFHGTTYIALTSALACYAVLYVALGAVAVAMATLRTRRTGP
jgi:Domain of unknown function (DUF4184)